MRLTGIIEKGGADVSSLSTEEKAGIDWLKLWPYLLAAAVLAAVVLWWRRKK
ncbi:Loki-CTERM sorting domain-containing protein [Methanocalculus taiwanensis]|uniref:Loki-CTERM sorting domain-containing protein n=1 Tax=Methanocalculus taiwanensis TaxID=106207 RepID=UPI00210166D4|nr:Loki-CTERM sorting domain-containing protein [Methanocalculus taiwanensis]